MRAKEGNGKLEEGEKGTTPKGNCGEAMKPDDAVLARAPLRGVETVEIADNMLKKSFDETLFTVFVFGRVAATDFSIFRFTHFLLILLI